MGLGRFAVSLEEFFFFLPMRTLGGWHMFNEHGLCANLEHHPFVLSDTFALIVKLTWHSKAILQKVGNFPSAKAIPQGGAQRHTRTRSFWHVWSHSNLVHSGLFTFPQAMALDA